MVGQLVQFKANVAVPIETRHVSSQKMWLPVPPADVDKDGKVTDRFKNAGTKAKKKLSKLEMPTQTSNTQTKPDNDVLQEQVSKSHLNS